MNDQPHPESDCQQGCPIHSAVRVFVRELLWVTAAAAALAISSIPLEHIDSYCGIWGCYPTMQSLASLHLLWLVGWLRVLALLMHGFPRHLRMIGSVILVVALAVATAMCVSDLNHWSGHVPDEDAKYWPQRVIYTLLTRWELPLLPAMLTGTIALVIGSLRRWRSRSKPGFRQDVVVAD